MPTQSVPPQPDWPPQDSLQRKFDEVLQELRAMAKSGPINEKRIQELASDLSRGLMEEAAVMRGQEATDPPAKCPRCGGRSFRAVRRPSPPGGGKKAGG